MFFKGSSTQNPPAFPRASYCYFKMKEMEHGPSTHCHASFDICRILLPCRKPAWTNLCAASFIKPVDKEKPRWPTSVTHPSAHKHTAVKGLTTSGSCWVTNSPPSMWSMCQPQTMAFVLYALILLGWPTGEASSIYRINIFLPVSRSLCSFCFPLILKSVRDAAGEDRSVLKQLNTHYPQMLKVQTARFCHKTKSRSFF